MNSIGSKVKAIRAQLNLNQLAFSEVIGISQGRLSEIEQDKTKPSADTLKEMRNRFNVDLNWLLNDTIEGNHLQQQVVSLLHNIPPSELEEIIEFIKLKKKRISSK